MPMYNPSHPGRIVRSGCLEPLGLSVTAGAKVLGVSRQALSSLVNGRARVTPEMARSPGEGLRFHSRALDPDAGGLGHCTDAQVGRRDQG